MHQPKILWHLQEKQQALFLASRLVGKTVPIKEGHLIESLLQLFSIPLDHDNNIDMNLLIHPKEQGVSLSSVFVRHICLEELCSN